MRGCKILIGRVYDTDYTRRTEFRQTLTIEERLYLLLIMPTHQGMIGIHIKNLEEKIRELEDALY
jgi:hypothetical protein